MLVLVFHLLLLFQTLSFSSRVASLQPAGSRGGLIALCPLGVFHLSTTRITLPFHHFTLHFHSTKSVTNPETQNRLQFDKHGHRISIREELSRRGSDWQYIFEMEHLPLHPTKPSLIEEKYPTVGHFEGKIFSSWACESGCYSC